MEATAARRGDVEDRWESFSALVGEAKAAARLTLRAVDDEEEREELMQDVWERAWKGYAPARVRAAEKEAAGKRFNWVGWVVRIAQNRLIDWLRRGDSFASGAGRRLSIEWAPVGRRSGAESEVGWGRDERRLWLVDENGPMPEELAAWEETCRALHECVDRLPYRTQRVLVLWGRRPNDVQVGRTLELSASTVRRERMEGLTAARECLTAKGITGENRGREPRRPGWSFEPRRVK